MSNSIEFYIPSEETIPTKLCLLVDRKYVEYEKKTGLSYVFHFFEGWTYDEAENATNRIADLMVSQSDDGYTRWVKTCVEPCGGRSFRVQFRVRDAG